MSPGVTLGPLSRWYVHGYRSRVTKETHAVITMKRNIRSPRLAVCGEVLTNHWRRPGGGITCGSCLTVYDSMDRLLEETS